MRKIVFCLTLLVATQSKIHAQSDQLSGGILDYKNAISIVPQYALISGFRFDYERRLKHKDKWLVFAPQFYINNGPNPEINFNYDYDKMKGLGMNIYYKHFLSHSEKKNFNGSSRTNYYFSTGPTFQYYNLINVKRIPTEFIEDGVTYIWYKDRDVTTTITKIGWNAHFGVQFAFGSFLLDLYFGIGIRYALDSNGNKFDVNESYWVSFDYTGLLFDPGLRFGYYFPRMP